MKKQADKISGSGALDFIALIMFLAASAFVIYELKQDNGLKINFRLSEPETAASTKPETADSTKPKITTPEQKPIDIKKEPYDDKNIKRLEYELDAARKKAESLEQQNRRLSEEKKVSAKTEYVKTEPPPDLSVQKELLLKEKEKNLTEKETLLEKKEKELMRKEEELKKSETK